MLNGITGRASVSMRRTPWNCHQQSRFVFREYQWTQLTGPAVTISNATLPTAKITAPHKLESYDLAFQLTVTDGSRTFSDTVSVNVPAASLLANWKFDDAVGSSTIVDSSGNGRSLALAGMATSDWVAPVTTNSANVSALHFGADSKSGSATLPGSTVDSISVWIKPDQNVTTSTGTSVIAEFGGGAKIGLGPWTGSVTGETISLLDSSGKYTSIANVQLDAGMWSHLALVWSDADARYDAFLNGQEMPVCY